MVRQITGNSFGGKASLPVTQQVVTYQLITTIVVVVVVVSVLVIGFPHVVLSLFFQQGM